MRKRLFVFVALALIVPAMFALVGCGSSSDSGSTARVCEFDVNAPNNGLVGIGTTLQLEATAITTTPEEVDVSAKASYSSSIPAVATVSSTGLVTGVAPGVTVITATYGGASEITMVRVGPVTQVDIQEFDHAILVGTTSGLTAIGTITGMGFVDMTDVVTWTSDDTTNAPVSAAGIVSGEGATDNIDGAKITAKFGLLSDTVGVYVSTTPDSITIDAEYIEMAEGTSQDLAVIANFVNSTSSNSQTLTGDAATWASDNADVTVGAATGIVTAASITPIASHAADDIAFVAADLTITAATGDFVAEGFLAGDTITVATAGGGPNDGDYTIDTAVANVITVADTTITDEAAGATVAVTETGEASITATNTIGFDATANPDQITDSGNGLGIFNVGDYITVTGSGGNDGKYIITSVTAGVLEVADGSLLADEAAGFATITLDANAQTSSNDFTFDAGTVTMSSPTSNLVADGFLDGDTITISGSASNDGDYTVNGLAAGSMTFVLTTLTDATESGTTVDKVPVLSTITATIGTATDSLDITVSKLASLALTPATELVVAGGSDATLQLTATGIFASAATQTLTAYAVYNSDDATTATVSDTGLVTGIKNSVTPVAIDAKFTDSSGDTTDTSDITVYGAYALSAIEILPDYTGFTNAPILEAPYCIMAAGTYTAKNGTNTQTTRSIITTDATWTSSNPSAVSINSNGTGLNIRGLGITNIGVSMGAIANTAPWNLSIEAVKKLDLTPATVSATLQTSALSTTGDSDIAATATLSSGTSVDVTSDVDFISNSTAVSVIPWGVAISTKVGVANISARLNGVDSTADVVVTTSAP